ncbi:MAG: isoleucine--tRNA ligase [Candidatus Pacebacteria bacterium]|jgi:isoleucyl-tRNA synthetase|nr:isoleucine--tRNA ligase [Candidatus Paceibacterota bacterium]|tara:strand:- start:15960 stop:18881 length:2922 start_codon:yes stop_codon:yes gene_type:complete
MNKDNNQKSEIAKKEEEILKFWEENKIFEKSYEKKISEGEFVFYEGPPTANGKPGIHHMESRAFKDVIPRYKTMRGFHVRRKAGWDTHGLPIELEVEKELGFKSKKEIEEYGIEKFNKKCKESAWKHINEWKKFTERIAFWLDHENPYITYEPEYIESVWSIIKKVNEQKLLYKDYKVVLWCPRCETGLSSHELALGYEEITDESVYVKFKVKNPEKNDLPKNTYILAWTTTPWTLPGNVALAVHKDIDYVLQADNFIVAHNRMEHISGISHNIKKELKGKDLIGLEYEPLYSYLKDTLPENQKEKLPNAYKIYKADFVNTDDGTGIVHTAVMYGTDDFELGTQVNLPKHHLVNESGEFISETDFLAGKKVREVDSEIIADLEKRNLLYKKEKIKHTYPHCWRCKTALVYFARDSWYIRMSELRDELVKENKGINWVPEHIREGRFGEWLSDVKDWAISRERYWGTPLPIWKKENSEEYIVIGSIEELKKYIPDSASLPQNENGEPDLHKPYIDEIEFIDEGGKKLTREKEVIDVWFDSGAMPFAQDHYPFENRQWVESKGYPADFISEAIDQTRGWFYTLHAIGILSGKGKAYRNVISLGHILDNKGKKMSKSVGNAVDPWKMIDKYGSDALRFWMYTVNQPGESKNFDEKSVDEVVKKVFNLLNNIVKFYELYAHEKSQTINSKSQTSDNVLDQWILARLNKLIADSTKNMDEFNVLEPARDIREFIADFSQWYIRRSRDRFKVKGEDKENALATTRYILLKLSKLMAPFTPFIAEQVYQKIKGADGKESVHLEIWPLEIKVESEKLKVLEEMEKVRKIASLGLEARSNAGIKVRQPLTMLRIANKESGIKNQEQLLQLIKDEINVKEIIFDENIENEVKLDTDLTQELKDEGDVRELTRAIQNARKVMKLTPQDSINIDIETDDRGKEFIEKFAETIKRATLAKEINFTEIEEEEIKIEPYSFKFKIMKT